MSAWRGDLPTIPAEQIRLSTIREGTRRPKRGQQRQSTVRYGAIGAVETLTRAYAPWSRIENQPSIEAWMGLTQSKVKDTTHEGAVKLGRLLKRQDGLER